MKKLIVTKSAVREYIRELMENPPGLGWQSTGDLSTAPVSVSAVVDPSAAVTDPGNPNYKPANRAELKTALSALVGDVPDDKIADFYASMTDTAQDLNTDDKDEEEDMAKGNKVEEAIRRAVRSMIKESKQTSHSTLKEFWQTKLNEAKPKGYNPFASTAKKEKAAARVAAMPEPTNPNKVEPKKYASADSGRSALQPPSPEKLAELRDLLEKFNVGEDDQENLIRLKAENRASAALSEALKGISDDDAENFSNIFNETKATLLDLATEDDAKSESPSKTDADEKLDIKGKKTKSGEKKLSAKEKKQVDYVVEDTIEFMKMGANADSYITSSKLFNFSFKEKFGKPFQQYCLDLGISVRQMLAKAAEEDEKRGYSTEAEMTLADTAAALGPDPKSGEIWSVSQVNKISQIVLGKFCLALKCLALGLDLDVEEDPKALAAALSPDSSEDEEFEEEPVSAQPSQASDSGAAIGDMFDALEEGDLDVFENALKNYIKAVFPKTAQPGYPTGDSFINSDAYKKEFGDISSLAAGLVGTSESGLERKIDSKIESGLIRFRKGM